MSRQESRSDTSMCLVIFHWNLKRRANLRQFDETIRTNQFQTLISFTEFSQLRLVMICMQFMDYPSTDNLKNNHEFMAVLTDLGGGVDHY